MTTHPIHTEDDHEAALARIAALWDALPGSPEHDELEVLAILVSAYEDRRWPIQPPDPVEAIKFHMEQNGLRQKDLANVVGKVSRASEILGRRRKLMVEMIRAIHSQWGIPLGALVGADAEDRAALRRRRGSSRRNRPPLPFGGPAQLRRIWASW